MHHDQFLKALMKLNYPQTQRAFTMIELIMVMVIVAGLSVVTASYIVRPIEQYQDQTRRAEMTNTADGAVRRMSREIHLALPNSVRSATNQCVEFIPTYDGGRYRAAKDNDGNGNEMQNNVAISNLDVIGSLNSVPVSVADDQLVVYNLGIPGLDVYAADNRTRLITYAGNTLSFDPKQFPIASPDSRFHLVSRNEQAVSFVCTGAGVDAAGNGTGTLFRVSQYGFNSPAPLACQAVGAGSPILATRLSACNFTYSSGVMERSAVVSIRLSIQQANETVTLYHDVNVNNVP